MGETKDTDPLVTDDAGDDHAEVENAAPKCAACLECDSKRETVSAGQPSWEHIPVLETAEQVRGYPNLQQTAERHIADPDGILARYDLPRPIEVPCSLKGRHNHGLGVVVRTLCDLVLCMGKTCGKKSIIGFDEIDRAVNARTNFQNDQRYLDGWTARYKERIAELDRPLRARHELLGTMRQLLPEMHAQLQHRSAQGPAGTAVEIKSGRDSQEPEIRHLAGLQLFRRTVPREEDLQRALAKFEDALRDAPPVDGQSARDLMLVAKGADTRADAAMEWVRETAHFLTENNLALALVALGRDSPSVEAVAGGLRVGYMPGRSALLTLPSIGLHARPRSDDGF